MNYQDAQVEVLDGREQSDIEESSYVGAHHQADRNTLMGILNSYVLSQSIYAAAKLGIADMLADGPKSVEELAAATNTHEPSLYRLLRALSSEGIFAETDQRRFQLTPTAEWLRSDTPGSLRGWAIFRGEPGIWRPWGEILYSVKTGKRAFDHVFDKPIWEYFEENPEAASIFDSAMQSISAEKFPAVADALDSSDISTLVDVGGGNGGLMIAMLRKNPHLKGVIAELPHVVENARKRIHDEGLDSRCRCVETDMFESVPKDGDAYIMAHIIHDWPDEESVRIMESCRKAMTSNERLFLVETLLSPPNTPHFSKLLDMEMLVLPGGLERTEEEYAALYEKAGFKLSRIIPTSTPWSILEGVAV